jgi:hypothetical protein
MTFSGKDGSRTLVFRAVLRRGSSIIYLKTSTGVQLSCGTWPVYDVPFVIYPFLFHPRESAFLRQQMYRQPIQPYIFINYGLSCSLERFLPFSNPRFQPLPQIRGMHVLKLAPKPRNSRFDNRQWPYLRDSQPPFKSIPETSTI